MKILIINQAYYPDTAAVSQHLTDLSVELVKSGHKVTIFTGNRAYENPKIKYPSLGNHHGVRVERLWSLGFGKQSKLLRVLGALNFFCVLFGKLFTRDRPDIVISMTLPPFVGIFGVFFCKLKKAKHLLWVMDLNPEEAIEAGWVRRGSFFEKILSGMAKKMYEMTDAICVMDDFMKTKVSQTYRINETKIDVCTPWPLDDHLSVVPTEENKFRKAYGLGGKFVLMYSGNHSICHPLDTILQAALSCRHDKNIVFCFVGGGVRSQDVTLFKKEHQLNNILQVGYQPVEMISHSLGAADLHIVVMGNPFVGIVHPCKIYGVLAVGKPFVYVGPEASPIGSLVKFNKIGFQVEHGNVQGLINIIEQIRRLDEAQRRSIEAEYINFKNQHYSKKKLVKKMLDVVASLK